MGRPTLEQAAERKSAQDDTQPAQPSSVNKPRPNRVPIGTRNVLTVKGRPGFVRRWMNDVDGRIEQATAAGYMPVEENVQVGDPYVGDPKKLGSVVTKSVGGGRKAVLMEIPEEYYREDQEARQAKIKAEEQQMLVDRGKPSTSSGDGMYGKVTLSQQR